MKVSLQGYAKKVTTFEVGAGVTPGWPVTISGSYTVENSAEDELFAGIALDVEGDCAAVQTHGFVTVPYDSAAVPTLGICGVAAAGEGKIAKADAGRQVLVVAVDADAKTADIIL